MATATESLPQGLLVEDWGLIAYAEAWERQRQLVQTAIANLPTWQDRLILCEHPSVITLGRNAHPEHILLPESVLQEKNVAVYAVERGGDVTYHGPGQLVGYPILWLERYKADVGWYMRSLEEVLIRTLRDWGLSAERIPNLTGVWLLNPPRKIAAMGVKLTRWVSMHGFALNVNTDLTGFSWIIPCGIRDKAVTSMHLELGYAPPMEAVKQQVIAHFLEIFGVPVVRELVS